MTCYFTYFTYNCSTVHMQGYLCVSLFQEKYKVLDDQVSVSSHGSDFKANIEEEKGNITIQIAM